MLSLPPWGKPLQELLHPKGITAEDLVVGEIIARPIIRFREHPNVAVIVFSGIVNPPHQRLMTNQVWQGAPENVNVSSRGTAKCLKLGTQIIMADGSLRAVEDVLAGESLMGPDSKPRRVLNTVNGVGPLFTVRQTSGMDYTVTGNHILSTKKKKNWAAHRQLPDVYNIETEAFAGKPPSFQEGFRGYRAGLLQYPERAVRLDPYFLGLWLGDGTSTQPDLTTADDEIQDFCQSYATTLGARLSVTSTALRSYGFLGKRNETDAVRFKHIPEDYLLNTEDARLELLAGLLDSDGTKDHGGYHFTQKSERLARDVKRLADGLGFRTALHHKPSHCAWTTAAGEHKTVDGFSWHLSIGGDVFRVPCKLPRKRYVQSDLRKNKDFLLSQLSVQPAGVGPWAGFELDGDHLFLLEDGTVTHNSTTVCVLDSALIAMLYAKKRIVVLSATGFRGGQNILNEMERWSQGKWDSQLPDISFVNDSIERTTNTRNLVHRAQNYWQISWGSDCITKTLPTNDEDRIRGERAHVVFLDEANISEDSLVSKVIRPFLAVKGGFDTGGANATSNMACYTLTVDYAWRSFMKTVQAAKDGIRRDFEIYHAAQRGDSETRDALTRLGSLQYTFVSFDYSDTIVREVITTRNGRKFKVKYPNANAEFLARPSLAFRDMPEGIPFTERDADGRIRIESSPLRGLTTYPIEKQGIERTLRDGSSEEASWLAENKNVVDSAAGDVYPHAVMDRVACVGDANVVPWSDCGPAWQQKYADEPDRGFTPPVMYECDDPCVLGVDVANGARDFAAFSVFRVGPAAEGDFNPLGTRALGKTPWSNVVWQEQHRLMSYRDIADKIRQFKKRYNLVFHHEPWKDDWEWCRAIGCDDRGGGTAVRDELLYLNIETHNIPQGEFRIFDPLDKEEKIGFVKNDPIGTRAIPMLDMIAANDTMNDRLVEFTLGQMKVGKLFIPKWLDESRRPDRDRKYEIGYLGARVLDHQLRKLQQAPTARARKFFMPGDAEDAKNKRDAWASFIYGAKQLRAHLIRLGTISTQPPAVGGVRTTINSKRGQGGRYGRSPGATF